MEGSTGVDYGPTFGKGDVVGCGVDWQEEAFYFTLNGKFLGECHHTRWDKGRNTEVSPTLGNQRSKRIFRKLYPILGMQVQASSVRANFGNRPFKFSREG